MFDRSDIDMPVERNTPQHHRQLKQAICRILIDLSNYPSNIHLSIHPLVIPTDGIEHEEFVQLVLSELVRCDE